VSDSTYVVNCFKQRWWEGWYRRGWKNTAGKPVANRDLWESLFALVLDGERLVTFCWVKGHSVTGGTTSSTFLPSRRRPRPRHRRPLTRAPSVDRPGGPLVVGVCRTVRSLPMELNGAAAIITGGARASGGNGEGARRRGRARHRVRPQRGGCQGGRRRDRWQGGGWRRHNRDDCEAAVNEAAEGAPLRIAVNCAGTGWVGRVINRDGTPHDPGAFGFIQQLNVIGTFNVMTLAAAKIATTEPLEFGERGVIINTASVAAFDGQIGQLAYSASKGAVVGMTLPAARDLSVVGIRVNTIAPGLFDTPLLAMLPEEARAALAQSVLFPKALGQPTSTASSWSPSPPTPT